MKKRFIAVALGLVMTASVFGSSVSAEEPTQVVKESNLNYHCTTGDLSALTGGQALMYTYGSGEGQSPLGTRIGESDWRLRNADETPGGSIGYSGETSPATFGITNSGYLQVKARPSVGANSTTDIYDTATAKRIPAIVLDSNSISNLSAAQKIQMEIIRTHHTVTAGVRFMVHNNGQDYYALILNGSQLTSKKAVELVKSVGGVVTTVGEFGTTTKTAEASPIWTEIYVNNGHIDVSVGGITGSYTDPEPFNVSGQDSKIWLMATNAGSNAERYGQFRNIYVNNLFIDTEPDTLMYIDAAEGKTADTDGVIDLGNAVSIRKLIYSGTETDKNILVSNDKQTWYILSNTGSFADGLWTNQLTSAKYRYVKAEGITQDIKFLTETYGIETTTTGNPITLYPRVGKKYAFDTTAVITSEPSGIISASGRVITPSARGTATITATVIEGEKTYAVSIPITIKGENEFVYDDDLSGASNQSLTGLGTVISGANWRMRNAAETPDGLKQHETTPAQDAKFGISSGALFLDAVFNSVQRYDTTVAKTIPSLVLTKDLTGLSSNQKITFSVNKYHQAVTSGIRFMVHNGGKDYYALIFGGNSYSSQSWDLVKSVDGAVSILASGKRTDYPGFDAMSKGQGAYWNVTLTVTGNDIKFTATQDGNSANTFSASYTDAEMFNVSGNDSGVWLMAMNGNGNTARNARFKNFKIENYAPYINGYEPSEALYIDAAEGKTADSEGVTDLGKAYLIRRINAEGSGNVYISKDKERWFNIGAVADGKVLNGITEQKVRYIKCDSGLSNVKALADTSEERIELNIGDSLTLYPYFNGEIPTDAALTADNTKPVTISGLRITGKSKGKGINLTVSSESAGKTISAILDVIDQNEAVFSYTADAANPNKVDFTVTAAQIKNGTYTVLIAFYSEDGALKNIQAFENINFDADGTAVFKADKVELSAGDYGKGFVWNTLDGAKPITSASDID